MRLFMTLFHDPLNAPHVLVKLLIRAALRSANRKSTRVGLLATYSTYLVEFYFSRFPVFVTIYYEDPIYVHIQAM